MRKMRDRKTLKYDREVSHMSMENHISEKAREDFNRKPFYMEAKAKKPGN